MQQICTHNLSRRRGIGKAAVFLVLGAVVTVAVAWAAALWSPVESTQTYSASSELARTHAFSAVATGDPSGLTVELGVGRRCEEDVIVPALAEWSDEVEGWEEPEPRHRTVTLVGWPMYAMQMSWDSSEFQPRGKGAGQRRVGASTSPTSTPRPALTRLWTEGIEIFERNQLEPGRDNRNSVPVRPVPLGFAVNTLVYAVLLAAGWRVARTFRRYHRVSAGRCAYCGYTLGLLDRCPECGGMLRHYRGLVLYRRVCPVARWLGIGIAATLISAWVPALTCSIWYHTHDAVDPSDPVPLGYDEFTTRAVAYGWGRRFEQYDGPANSGSQLFISRVGWPMYAMRMVWHGPASSSSWWGHGVPLRAQQPLTFGAPTNLPLRPLPMGFVVNTLIYAAGFAAAWHGSRVVRLRQQRRRGRDSHLNSSTRSV